MGKYGRFHFGSAHSENAWIKRPAEPDPAEDELHFLRRELTALKVTLADREKALAKAALDAQLARDRWQRELSNAEKAWKAAEAARLAAAEAQWREQSDSALAEVTARCEAAELMLEQLSQHSTCEQNLPLGGVVSAEHANRQSELHHLLSTPRTEPRHGTQESNIVIRTNRARAAQAMAQERHASRKYAPRNIFAAASLGLFALAVYAGIGTLLWSWP